VELRCGECAALVTAGDSTCPGCGRTLGSAPTKGKRPGLLVWAAVAAAVEVALTLVIMRSCG
jgi:hypothetical protein